MTALLDIQGLRTVFHLLGGAWSAVDGIDLKVERGEILCLVGESGSGKSVTGFSIVQLIDAPGEIVEGKILFNGSDLRMVSDEELRSLRGDRIAMIFQDPLSTLNPVLTVGEQMLEAIFEHRNCSREKARIEAMDALTRVGISSPEARLKQYPHEFSGGMRQRVAIAIALLNSPDLIIADEPTTALDVTIQSQILYEVQKLARQTGTAVLWITHDLAVVAELADRVAVMYAGQIVESGSVDDVLDNPMHPYTLGLLSSSTGMAQPGERLHQINGNAPRIDARPSGCPFRTRCDRVIDVCTTIYPEKQHLSDHSFRCHNPVATLEVIS
ncbi:ABC transporter ATP-binding protein [Brucella pseudogrignonensis]|uniref:ABC transporter ATP-binding protein n=1 Tax=Brucella pseudogrignonensis TaxID=419475 RepID=UPI000CFB2DC8|nr:ABC transporter ATP-binding protein [Brucella pseudogrignonensis]MQP41003.1 ATP-binding cassette domain-containing protein [Ochrobactrum sp. MYb237]PQZ40953.1 methionine ABC transporter ATP-binding protein [Brucella pseudogrignonensis]PRA40328.1 methionine ABC transporter ATP-binding protein [Brucella pseudogrignonensis]PRA68921.1 methionine ABC transporter ATP-binding protein [Brucella pseudogrignonensis]